MSDSEARTIAWAFWTVAFPFMALGLIWIFSGGVEHFTR